ncbi:MAG: hypothetical protein IJ523_10700 [Succinivibrionaceae bacterium]|nr:hypothetical protein [Succinivibrionaceae bacterium]
MDRDDVLRDIAQRIEDMVCLHGRRNDIAITYEKGDDVANELSPFQRERFRVMQHCSGEEYFFVYETPDRKNLEPRNVLYVVCVTADSYLTAAQELIDLCAKKF